jgi:LCP family protein required for cell wall assembly
MKKLFLKLRRKLKSKSSRGKRKSGSFNLISSYKKKTRSGGQKRFESGSIVIILSVVFIAIVVWCFFCIYKLLTADISPAFRDERSEEIEWKGESQINILLVGMDAREGEFGYIDALAILVIDPLEKQMGIFDINVDTTINIGQGRSSDLRSLYNLGVLESETVPIELLISGVETLLSIKVNRYVMLEEDGLVEVANSLGGIYVKNSSEIEDQDIEGFKLAEGSFRLGGEDFLDYLRVDDDGIESKFVRQIEGMKGLFQRAASYNVFIRFPSFIYVLEKRAYTDLSKGEIIRVGYEITRLHEINSAFMGDSSLQKKVSGGEEFYLPILEVLDEDIQSVFSDSRIAKEQARVEIFNSTNIQGLATFRARWLRNIGVDVIRTGDTAKQYETTTVFTQERGKYTNTISAIRKTFDEEVEIIYDQPDFICTGDVIIILGSNVSE